MKSDIPEKFHDLFEKKSFAHLATAMADGSSQVTPVWCDFDGEHVLINSAKGRLKDRNIRRDPRVSLSICDPDNGYRYVELRGEVVDIVEEGAVEHIDKLAKRYMDKDRYPFHNDDDVRVIYKIAARKASAMG